MRALLVYFCAADSETLQVVAAIHVEAGEVVVPLGGRAAEAASIAGSTETNCRVHRSTMPQ
ncbi:MAG: hypothetical protein ABSH20_24440 [Tepidisphaeraceae bacterium]